MKKHILSGILLPVMLAVVVAGCATSPGVKKTAVGDEAVITGIQLEDNSLTIRSNRHFTYTIYSTDDPYKITVDIPDMSVGSFTSKIESDKAGFTEIIPRQTSAPDRAVKIDVVLQSPAPVEPSYSDNTLTIKVKPEQPAAAEGTDSQKAEEAKAADESAVTATPVADEHAEAASASDATENKAAMADETAGGSGEAAGNSTAEKTEEALPKATEITGVKLKRSGAALQVVISGNGAMVPNVFPLDKRVVIDVPGVALRTSLPKSVMAPLSGIRAGKHRDKIRLVLDLSEKTGFEVAAVGDSIVISLQRKGAAAVSAPSEATSAAAAPQAGQTTAAQTPQTAQPAGKAGLSGGTAATASSSNSDIMGEAQYKGKKISLDFQDADIVPIFRLLADVNGYNLVVDPAVHGKITIKLMNVPWDQALDIILHTFNLGKSIEGNILWIAPNKVFTKIIDEKKKKESLQESAEELKQEIIRVNYATAGSIQSAITSGKLLSPRGSITIDSRMNTLIVKDTQKSIDKIKDLVKIMDVAKPEVMIEAKIVQVSNDYNQTLGINWGASLTSQTFPNVVDGAIAVNTPVVAPTTASAMPGGALGMTIGHANTAQISLSLQALETVGKAKTLSNPKILTMDNEAATIQQGKTFFIPTTSQAGTQTQSEQATLMLRVTPKIAPNGYVQLKVSATDNSLEPGTAGANAVVDTKSIKTQALVGDGETLVLGGIYTTTETESEDRVPLLGQIPVIGWLFKTSNKVGPSYSELLIFITPRVVKRAM